MKKLKNPQPCVRCNAPVATARDRVYGPAGLEHAPGRCKRVPRPPVDLVQHRETPPMRDR